MLRHLRAELTAVPLRDPEPGGVTRRHIARVNREDGTFMFRHLPEGAYRIEGTVTAGFRLRSRRFCVRGEVVAKPGDEDVELRLVFAPDDGG